MVTGLLVIATSQTLTVKKSLEKMYFPFLLKQASLIDVTISVKKFFLAGSSYSASVCAELSQMPDYVILRCGLLFSCRKPWWFPYWSYRGTYCQGWGGRLNWWSLLRVPPNYQVWGPHWWMPYEVVRCSRGRPSDHPTWGQTPHSMWWRVSWYGSCVDWERSYGR